METDSSKDGGIKVIFPCPFCSKAFQTKDFLKKHLSSDHGVELNGNGETSQKSVAISNIKDSNNNSNINEISDVSENDLEDETQSPRVNRDKCEKLCLEFI